MSYSPILADDARRYVRCPMCSALVFVKFTELTQHVENSHT